VTLAEVVSFNIRHFEVTMGDKGRTKKQRSWVNALSLSSSNGKSQYAAATLLDLDRERVNKWFSPVRRSRL
jgi:hypothetical protein